MATTSACPKSSDLQQLATGTLPAAEMENILQHLESCPQCLSKVPALSANDTLVDALSQSTVTGEGPEEEIVSGLIARLTALPKAPLSPEDAAKNQLTFPCSSCGKSLKAKAGLAGKKVKCPKCGQATTVPASGASEEKTLAPHERLAGASETGTLAANPAYIRESDKELLDFLDPAQSADELGRLRPYRVLRVLGTGGMGVVFRAEDPHLQRVVALKAMLPILAASASAKQRFLREARAAAAIKHDHIVTIHQVAEHRGAPYLAMEFLEGESLDDRLKREGKLPLPEVLRIGKEMAEGLAAAHERELIHRDIKPANVWLERRRNEPEASATGGRVKILDFGLARAATDQMHLTHTGAIVGTPAYMSPEQAQSKGVGPRSDLFSLGCVLYRMATGEPAFRGSDMIGTLLAVSTETPRPPQELNAGLPTALSDLIMRLLDKDPAMRPANASEVIKTLQMIENEIQPSRFAPAGSQATAVSPINKPREAPAAASGPASAKRKRRLLVATAAGIAVVLIGLWAGGVFRLQTKDGTIVIEDLPDNAEILVDGQKAKIKPGPDGKWIEVQVAPGEHKLLIKAAGFVAKTQDITLGIGERKPLRLRLEPVVAAGPLTNPKANVEPGPTEIPPKLGPVDILTSPDWEWSEPENLGPNINSDKRDIFPTLSADGLILIFSSDRGGNRFQLYECRRAKTSEPFGKPVEIKEFRAGTASAGSPFLTGDGLTLLFNSTRTGGSGSTDIWMTCRARREALWQQPVNIGPPVNTDWHEESPALSPDGLTLYFSSNRGLSIITYRHLWMSRRKTLDAPFEEPVKLGRDINAASHQEGPYPTADGRGLLFHRSSARDPRLYLAVRAPQDEWTIQPLGLPGESDGKIRDMTPALSADGRTLFFSSDRPGGQGDTDLWMVRRVPRKKPLLDGAQKQRFTNSLGMEFALVPKGKAWLGGGGGIVGDKEVEFKEDFYLGVYEVTQEEWEKVTGVNPSYFRRGGPGQEAIANVSDEDLKRFPVEWVGWDDAQAFLDVLNKRLKEPGWVYRLPTEAEWEYACRGGPITNKFTYAFDFYLDKPANTLQADQANCQIEGKGLMRPCKVGSYKPNQLGLYDMHGNVFEWCNDIQKATEAEMKELGVAEGRVIRGGSWSSSGSWACTATWRSWYPQTGSHTAGRRQFLGLRLARVPVAGANRRDTK